LPFNQIAKAFCALLIYRYQFADTECKKLTSISKIQAPATTLASIKCKNVLAIHEDFLTKCDKQAKEVNTCKVSTM